MIYLQIYFLPSFSLLFPFSALLSFPAVLKKNITFRQHWKIRSAGARSEVLFHWPRERVTVMLKLQTLYKVIKQTIQSTGVWYHHDILYCFSALLLHLILHVSGKQNSQDCSPLNTSGSYSLVLFSLLLVQITGTNRRDSSKTLWVTETNPESLRWLLGTLQQQA